MTRSFIQLKEAAKYLGITEGYLYKLVHFRKIPYYRPNGKKLFFNVAELDAWVAAGRVATSEELATAANMHDAQRRS